MPFTGIESIPRGAKVYINNKLVGTTPFGAYWIKKGDKIRIELEGYDVQTDVITSEDLGTTLIYTLSKFGEGRIEGVTIESSGIGTGQKEGKPTGVKDSFDEGEYVYAAWKISGDIGGKISKIFFYHRVNDNWVLKKRSDADIEKDWNWFWHWFRVRNIDSGEWKVEFKLDGKTLKTYFFTYGKKPVFIVPEEETIDFWVKKGYTTEEAEAISRWVRENQASPSPETIQKIIEEITPPKPIGIPKISWWDRLLDLGVFPKIGITSPIKAYYETGYELLTGRKMTDEEFLRVLGEQLDIIGPINFSLILFTGENLEGKKVTIEDNEFWWEAAATALLAVPLGRIGRYGTKLAEKISPKGFLFIIEKLGLNRAPDAMINLFAETSYYKWLLELIRKNPRSWAKVAPKLSPKAQALISAGLEKQHPRVAYKLMEKALIEDAEKTAIGLGIKLPPIKPKTILWSLAGIIGLISFGYTVSFATEWTAKEALDELLRVPLEDRLRDYRKNPTKEKREAILRFLDKLDSTVPIAEKLIKSVSWLWPLTKHAWNLYVENLKFVIEEDRKELERIPTPEPMGSVRIETNVPDANIWYELGFLGKGTWEGNLSVGKHTITISHDAYEPWSEEVNIIEGDNPEIKVWLVLKEQVGTISVSSNPEKGAMIYLDGKPTGKETDNTLYKVPLGSHEISIFKEAFGGIEYISEPDKINVELTEVGESKEVEFNLISREIPPEKGAISVTSEPTGATIWYDSTQAEFPTNTVIKDLDPGEYEVRIHKTGYIDPEPKRVLVQAGKTIPVDFGVLEPEPPTKGKLVIDIIPGDVYIYEKGKEKYHIDSSGHFEVELDPGYYEFILKKKNYKDKNIYVQIKPGLTETKSLVMTQETPDYGKVIILTNVPYVDVKRAYIYLGTTNANGILELSLPQGSHTLIFVKEDYESERKDIYVRAGEEQQLSVEMTPISLPSPVYNAWAYHIDTIPSGAKIIIDGVFTGKWTPDTIYLSPEAEYMLRLEKVGYYPYEMVIETEALPSPEFSASEEKSESLSSSASSSEEESKKEKLAYEKELNHDKQYYT